MKKYNKYKQNENNYSNDDLKKAINNPLNTVYDTL